MAKMPKEIEVNINTEKAMKVLEKELEKKIKEIKNRGKEIYIEKIAFSLFSMFYYKHFFTYDSDDYLLKLQLGKMKDLWVLGKMKNKLKKFFDLANKFYEIDLNNKENNNENNRK